ncbi:MAG TPA: serine hydrolase domain-containing protein, partial [Chondromyces sp.]|nr:serine hydrolase domain-containing protein [Chondromyces sp.]
AVTIHHLLSHTSGMKDYVFKNDVLPGWYSLQLPYQKMMELWANRPFDNKPGENFDYNNWGYYLLGQIIEKVTGISWANYGEPELLKPLGLNKTLFAHQQRIVSGRAKGYHHQKDSLMNVPYRNVETFSAGGGLSSTIDDIIQWTHLLHSGKVVSAASLNKMTTPTLLNNGKTEGYGYGLYVNELHGHRKIYHGGTFGFGTFVSHYPEEGITIAILSNSTKGREKAEQLEEILATAALNIKIKDLILSAADIELYSGVYTYQSTPTKVSELKVIGESGRLMAQFGNNKPFHLRSQGNHKFIPVTKGITNINFEIKKKKAVGLTIHEGAWEITKGTRK